ncbi:MAG: hypothetical protein BWY82_01106 [Verrucomicrobia bacterium ADurb.Bin474]|nr:MAG: hypothetical protein BWY82_01106 [Verrucomicrobia bacterium ADurb.Bin474]
MVYTSNVSLFVAPVSCMNSLVTTEMAEPTSFNWVFRRVPASVLVAMYPTFPEDSTTNGLST